MIGHWVVVHALFEKGWPKQQDMQAVYTANFQDAVRFLSRENAMI